MLCGLLFVALTAMQGPLIARAEGLLGSTQAAMRSLSEGGLLEEFLATQSGLESTEEIVEYSLLTLESLELEGAEASLLAEAASIADSVASQTSLLQVAPAELI